MVTATLPVDLRSDPNLPRLLTRPLPRWRTFLTVVLPLSLLPPLASAYSMHRYPGFFLPPIAPAHQFAAALLIGVATLALEWGLVTMMAAQILLLGGAPDSAFVARVSPLAAYRFAGLAPAPLWLASLALLVPSRLLLAVSLALAWLLVGLLVREGVTALYRPDSPAQTRKLVVSLLVRGVFAWIVILGGLLLPLAAMSVLD